MNRTHWNRWITAFFSLAALAVALAPASALAGDAEKGKALYMTNCLSCHGETGKGDGPVGALLQPPPRNFAIGGFILDADGDGKPGSDADLKEVVTKGAAAFGGNALMAPWAGMLSSEDIDNVLAFVRTLKE
jgi:mono/diheme cytochrome c family protein